MLLYAPSQVSQLLPVSTLICALARSGRLTGLLLQKVIIFLRKNMIFVAAIHTRLRHCRKLLKLYYAVRAKAFALWEKVQANADG